jgi:hypothetical protein
MSGRLAACAGVALIAFFTTGCAQPLPHHEPTMLSLGILRGSTLPAMQVGQFALAPGKPASMDRSVTLRSVTMHSPDGDSFAQYLGKTVETDLRAAGKLDLKSPLVIKGLLTDSGAGAGLATGDASLAATFSVLKDDREIFHKDLAVSAQWDSSFIGAVAIPAAMNQYFALYEKLASQLFADKDFVAAVTKN